MTDLENEIQAVEGGLLTANHIQGRSQQPLKLSERLAHYRVPGIGLALIQQDEIAWAAGYGHLEAGGDASVTGDTLFQAASISKPVIAMAALRLVQEGVLDLDADVNRVLRSWQVPENEHTQTHKVTLRGLARVCGWPGFQREIKTIAHVDPAVYARYEGRYRFAEAPDWGAAVVRENDHLVWQELPAGLRYELYPESETVFFSLESPQRVTFVRAPDGSVTTVLFGEYERLERVG